MTVITGFPRYNVESIGPKYRGKVFLTEHSNGIRIIRTQILPLPRWDVVRKIEYFLAPIAFLLMALFDRKHDVAIAYSPPITMGICMALLKISRGTPYIFNVQDIHPQALRDLGFLADGLMWRFLQWCERLAYRSSDRVSVHSDGNAAFLTESRDVPRSKVVTVPNWVDTEVLCPGERMNWFRKEHGLDDDFVVSFAGTMGTSQDMATIVKAADLLRKNENIRFVLVGDGVEKPMVERQIANLMLKNVKLLPMQPRHLYPSILHASDLCLVTLKGDVVTPVVPSKLLSIMACGRPVLASLDMSGDTPRIIDEARCGVCVEAENAQAMGAAVERLYRDRDECERMGENGREYCLRRFSKLSAMDLYAGIFEEVLASNVG